jgi:hypothetical protein
MFGGLLSPVNLHQLTLAVRPHKELVFLEPYKDTLWIESKCSMVFLPVT